MDLFQDRIFEDTLQRINQIKEGDQAQWGTMDPAQMFAHCAEVQEVLNGKELKNSPLFIRLFKGFIRKSVLSDKPYKMSSPTHPQYQVEADRDFEIEKSRLIKALRELKKSEDFGSSTHSLFGKMSNEERSWAAYKHLDHHLRQYGK
ncbi:MAG: DUF1569 domain-containing protein [Bacteroidota bacterium]